MGMNKGDDPGAYTVEDVKAYLETADDAERDRVYAAENAGKARVGVLGENTEATPVSGDAAAQMPAGPDLGDLAGRTHSTGPDYVNPMADPDHAAKAYASDEAGPTPPGSPQTPAQKAYAEKQDEEQQAKIAEASADADAAAKPE